MTKLRLSILIALLCAGAAQPALAAHHRPHANKYEKTIAKQQKKQRKQQAKAIKAWRRQHEVGH